MNNQRKEHDMIKKTIFIVLIPMLMLVMACSKDDESESKVEPVIPTEMTVTCEDGDITKPLAAGTIIKLVAQFAPENATETAVAWVSSNTYVATVVENGVLVLLNNGTTVITAVSVANPKLTWSTTITVKGGSIPVNPEGPGQNEAE